MSQRQASRRVLLFANPIAGRGRGKSVASALEAALTAAGYTVESPPGRPEAATWPLDPPPIAALVIGGDGTLRAFVERMKALGPLPPILPIPMGTANLMGRHLGLRWTPHTLVPAMLDILARGRVLHLDAGIANGRLFLLIVGIGLDADVVRLLDRARTGPIDYSSYVLPTARALAGYLFPKISVWIDDQPVIHDTPAMAFIGNVKEYGTGLPILMSARPDDGLLDVCILPCKTPFELAEILLSIASGDHPDREGVIYQRGQTIRVDAPHPVAVQIDGDVAGFTPLVVHALPHAIPMLTPAAEAPR